MDGLQRLVAQRAQPFPILAKRLDDVRIHPCFGPDEKETARVLDAAEIMEIDIATISQQQTGSQRGWLGQKRLFIGRVGRQDHDGGGIAQQIHSGVEFHGSRLDHFEAPRKDFAQAVVDGEGTAVLNNNMTKLGESPPLFEPKHFQRHLADEPFRHAPGEIGKVGLRHLVIEGFVGDGGPKERIETAAEIGQCLDTLAGTGRCQRQS